MRLVACLFLFMLAAGCQSPDRQLMEALSTSWGLLRPYCLTGIAIDGTLDPDERALRNRQVEEFSLTLQAGLEASRDSLETSDATASPPRTGTTSHPPSASSPVPVAPALVEVTHE